MNTLAGCELNNKNASTAPTSENANIAIVSYPTIQDEPNAITPYARKAITERPPHNPSNPSAILTAFVVPTNINNTNTA